MVVIISKKLELSYDFQTPYDMIPDTVTQNVKSEATL